MRVAYRWMIYVRLEGGYGGGSIMESGSQVYGASRLVGCSGGRCTTTDGERWRGMASRMQLYKGETTASKAMATWYAFRSKPQANTGGTAVGAAHWHIVRGHGARLCGCCYW